LQHERRPVGGPRIRLKLSVRTVRVSIPRCCRLCPAAGNPAAEALAALRQRRYSEAVYERGVFSSCIGRAVATGSPSRRLYRLVLAGGGEGSEEAVLKAVPGSGGSLRTLWLILGDHLNPEHSWFGSVNPNVT